MNPDVKHVLKPRRFISVLDTLTGELAEAAEQWELLNESVPAPPAYSELLQHAVKAQELSREVLRLAADFARSPHSTTRDGRTVLVHLATAAISAHAVPNFALTAENSLFLHPSAHPTVRKGRESRMTIDHATARANLMRASQALRDSAKELERHSGFHRFFPKPSRQENPDPRSPGPAHAAADPRQRSQLTLTRGEPF